MFFITHSSKGLRALVASVLAFAAVGPATAIAGGRVGLQGGAAVFPSKVEVDVDGEKLDADAADGGLLGVEGGWNATDSLELGGLIQVGGALYDESVFSATVGPRYSFLEKGSLIRPFAVGQMGFYNLAVELSEYPSRSETSSVASDDGLFNFGPDESESGFGLNLGGGIDVYPLEWLSVGVDVRYHHAFVFEGVDYVTTTLGAAWHFG